MRDVSIPDAPGGIIEGPIFWLQMLEYAGTAGGQAQGLFVILDKSPPLYFSGVQQSVLPCPRDRRTGVPKPWRRVKFVKGDGTPFTNVGTCVVRVGELEEDSEPRPGPTQTGEAQSPLGVFSAIGGRGFFASSDPLSGTAPAADGEYEARIDKWGGLRVSRIRRTRTVLQLVAQASNGNTGSLPVDDCDEVDMIITNNGTQSLSFQPKTQDALGNWVPLNGWGGGAQTVLAGANSGLFSLCPASSAPFGAVIRIDWTLTAGGIFNVLVLGK